jgi:hypothetical protein
MNRSMQMSGVVALVMMALATPALAATSTTLAGATAEFDGLFRLGLYILGLAGLMTIAYVVARNRYGIVWDEGIAVIAACAIGASAITMLGWVGVTEGATLPLPPLP